MSTRPARKRGFWTTARASRPIAPRHRQRLHGPDVSCAVPSGGEPLIPAPRTTREAARRGRGSHGCAGRLRIRDSLALRPLTGSWTEPRSRRGSRCPGRKGCEDSQPPCATVETPPGRAAVPLPQAAPRRARAAASTDEAPGPAGLARSTEARSVREGLKALRASRGMVGIEAEVLSAGRAHARPPQPPVPVGTLRSSRAAAAVPTTTRRRPAGPRAPRISPASTGTPAAHPAPRRPPPPAGTAPARE